MRYEAERSSLRVSCVSDFRFDDYRVRSRNDQNARPLVLTTHTLRKYCRGKKAGIYRQGNLTPGFGTILLLSRTVRVTILQNQHDICICTGKSRENVGIYFTYSVRGAVGGQT